MSDQTRQTTVSEEEARLRAGIEALKTIARVVTFEAEWLPEGRMPKGLKDARARIRARASGGR